MTTWFLTCMNWELSSVLCSLACISYKVCSRLVSLDSVDSCIECIGSAGVPGWESGGFGAEYESRWTRACLDARRLISRRPTRSPRLKLPLPCLNSHSGDSGEPVWKTSLTERNLAADLQWLWLVIQTFVESVHIQLSYKWWNICMLEILPVMCKPECICYWKIRTHERTFEKSLEGDMTKLSAEFDQDIRCWILWSSSMLWHH